MGAGRQPRKSHHCYTETIVSSHPKSQTYSAQVGLGSAPQRCLLSVVVQETGWEMELKLPLQSAGGVGWVGFARLTYWSMSFPPQWSRSSSQPFTSRFQPCQASISCPMANRLSLLCTLILSTAAMHRLPPRSIAAHTQSRNHVPLENRHLPREVGGCQRSLDW